MFRLQLRLWVRRVRERRRREEGHRRAQRLPDRAQAIESGVRASQLRGDEEHEPVHPQHTADVRRAAASRAVRPIRRGDPSASAARPDDLV